METSHTAPEAPVYFKRTLNESDVQKAKNRVELIREMLPGDVYLVNGKSRPEGTRWHASAGALGLKVSVTTINNSQFRVQMVGPKGSKATVPRLPSRKRRYRKSIKVATTPAPAMEFVDSKPAKAVKSEAGGLVGQVSKLEARVKALEDFLLGAQ